MSIFDEIRNDKNYSTTKSFSWFKNKVAELNGNKFLPGDKKLFTENKEFIKTRLYPGSCYFYSYDPKHKATLPYYDTFPLTFIINITGTHFTGINFHYLPQNIRFILYDKLLKNKTTWSQDDMKRIRADWELLSNVARFPEVQPAVKMYLNSHVTSKFIRVPIDDMKTALLLPVEKFKKATALQVQRQSLKMIKARK